MSFHNLDELRRVSAGRWTEILISAGIPASVLDGRNHPCPKCGGRDRFSAFRDLNDRGAVHCRRCFTRGSAIAPGDGIATLRWWLNQSFSETLSFLAESVGMTSNQSRANASTFSWRHPPHSIAATSELSENEIEAHTEFARDAYNRLDNLTRRKLSQSLRVSTKSLSSLRVGLTSDGRCSTWPMRDHRDQIVGVRIAGLPWTEASNAKWSRRGSQGGVFIARPVRLGEQPCHAGHSELFVVEGESDTAAAVSLGMWTIGRASCSSSTFFIDQYVNTHNPSTLVIIADNDDPGRQGAKRLAKSIAGNLPSTLNQVDVITPPVPTNDLRDWISGGANRIDIRDAKPIATYRSPNQTMFDFA